MTDQNELGRNLIERFAPQVRWVVDSVMITFDLPAHERDDWSQEASILLLSYADLLNKKMWGHGKLALKEDTANGDEDQVKALVARQLRIDLSQKVARELGIPLTPKALRQLEHEDDDVKPIRSLSTLPQMTSLDAMAEYGEELSDQGAGEREMIEGIDNRRETDRAHRLYPSFARNVLDGMTQAQIAEADGVGHATVERRIAREKASFLTDQERYALIGQIQERGLMVEGNETLDELREAVKYLVAS